MHHIVSLLQQCCKAYPVAKSSQIKFITALWSEDQIATYKWVRRVQSTDQGTELGKLLTSIDSGDTTLQLVYRMYHPTNRRGCHCQSGHPRVRTTSGFNCPNLHAVLTPIPSNGMTNYHTGFQWTQSDHIRWFLDHIGLYQAILDHIDIDRL